MTYTIADSKVDMRFLAKVIQTGATIPTVGEVKSVVTLTVEYQ